MKPTTPNKTIRRLRSSQRGATMIETMLGGIVLSLALIAGMFIARQNAGDAISRRVAWQYATIGQLAAQQSSVLLGVAGSTPPSGGAYAISVATLRAQAAIPMEYLNGSSLMPDPNGLTPNVYLSADGRIAVVASAPVSLAVGGPIAEQPNMHLVSFSAASCSPVQPPCLPSKTNGRPPFSLSGLISPPAAGQVIYGWNN